MRPGLKFIVTGLFAVGATALATGALAEVSVERGRYLVDNVALCHDCHTPRLPDQSLDMVRYLAGGNEYFEEGLFRAFARNITPDVETGIGSWTEADIVTAIREGHTPEDEAIGPPMPVPNFNTMSNDDAASIAAYLKTVPAVRNEVPDSEYNIPVMPMPPAAGNDAPPAGPTAEYGRYLVTALASCFDCHTPRNPDGSPDMARLGAGGFLFADLPTGTVFSANITPDPETGIGNWSDAAITRAITEGLSSNGHILFPAMPSEFYRGMTEDDVAAIVAFIRTIPPVVNDIEQVDWMAGFGMPPMQNAPPLD